MRNLASIQKITDIRPIPDADQIEVARVLGWEVVVRKAENHQIGDSVVYIEVDSVLPDKPEFEFMCERKFRVKTIKLRKQISQGLVFPLSVLPQKKYREGDDVTNIIGVTKYDPEAIAENLVCKRQQQKTLIGKLLYRFAWYRKYFCKRGGKEKFPRGIHKTDEIRIQSCPSVLDYHRGESFYVTEKLDGQSATYFINKKDFGICSRNFIVTVPDSSSYWRVAKKYNMKDILIDAQKEYGVDLALQGENVGYGVENSVWFASRDHHKANIYNLTDNYFFLFNVWDITHQKFFTIQEMIEFVNKYGLRTVPIINSDLKLDFTVNELISASNIQSTLNGATPIEGLVFRENNKTGFDRCSFKVINNEFLLKYGL